MDEQLNWDKIIPKDVRKRAASMAVDDIVSLLISGSADVVEKLASNDEAEIDTAPEMILGMSFLAAAKLIQLDRMK